MFQTIEYVNSFLRVRIVLKDFKYQQFLKPRTASPVSS